MLNFEFTLGTQPQVLGEFYLKLILNFLIIILVLHILSNVSLHREKLIFSLTNNVPPTPPFPQRKGKGRRRKNALQQ